MLRTLERLTSVLAAMFVLAAPQHAVAIPLLQVYIEGGNYDQLTESWMVVDDGPLRLWVIGNVGGAGGTIEDVRLSIAYRIEEVVGSGPTFSLNPSTTGGFGGYNDPSAPADPFQHLTSIRTSINDPLDVNPDGVVDDFGRPVLFGGKALSPHGVYGDGTLWQEFSLGDFTLLDSQIEDFIGQVPTPDATNDGQINVYEVSTTNGSGMTLHFDAYNHVEAVSRGRFAPFSHDAFSTSVIPEPATFAIWSVLGAIGLVAGRWRHRRRAV